MTDAATRSQPRFEFDEDTAVERVEAGRWRGEVSPRWSIGPYPNGGYVLAVALAAVRGELPAAHPHPFAVSAHYLRPTSHGPVDIAVEVVRSGRGHSTAEARMVQEGTERARLIATYGDLGEVSGPTVVTATPPPLPPPEDCLPNVPAPMPNQLVAEIRRRLDIRFAPGTADFMVGRRHGIGRVGGWVGFTDGRPVDVDALPFLCDAFPPAVFDLVDRPGWVPTLEYTVHVRGVPAPGPLQAWFSTRALIDGYLEEDGELWDSRGRLVAMSRQLARLNPPPA